jgi:ferric-dicitrate binding protein FerR (iron transport regulator)
MDDEAATMLLLRLSGPRSPVPATRAARVRTTVHDAWKTRTRRRTSRRRTIVGAAVIGAAAVVLIAARFARSDREVIPAGDPMAVVEQVIGTPQRVSYSRAGPTRTQLALNEVVRSGEWIETGTGARAGLRLADGASVRLDAASRLRALSARRIELAAGAVYIDSEGDAPGFEVLTPFATARDIGTQFELRLLASSVRLRVRTGEVELQDGTRLVSGRAGTEITLSASGAVSRPLAVYGSEWEWTAALTAPLDIEGMALAAYLDYLAREHGWVLQYSDQALAREATGITLHGSTAGLSAAEAAATAVAASGLRHRLENGTLFVQRETSGR